jgi:predicted DNA-binding transcriptional regulator AlpA
MENTNHPSPTRLLTVDEVAVLLRRSPAAVRYMRQVGTGPRSAKIAGRVMYKESEVIAYIDAAFKDES